MLGWDRFGCSPRFLAKTLPKCRIFGEVFPQDLDRHIPFQHQVPGFVNHSHAASPQRILELVTIIEQAWHLHSGDYNAIPFVNERLKSIRINSKNRTVCQL
jgi:hypothetical protein